MPIPSIKEIFDLIKTGATIEAQEKIMELRESALEFREENLNLKMRVKELEGELNQKRNLKHERGLYWLSGDRVPFCPRCWENAGKLIHLAGPMQMASSDVEGWQCHVCHNDYFAKLAKDFAPNLNRARFLQSSPK